MSARHRIQSLLEHPRIWQASRPTAGRPALSTGYRDLDRALTGGWPTGELTELLLADWGLGEFRLLLPALASLSRERSGEDSGRLGKPGWIMFVNPPYIPYAPGLHAAGIDVSRIIVASGGSEKDILWSLEQSLMSASFSAVIGYCGALSDLGLRRLQLAAETGGCWALLFRSERFRRQRSPAALRMCLAAAPDRGLVVEILKQRGGRPRRLWLDA